jgi:hypothetical protein
MVTIGGCDRTLCALACPAMAQVTVTLTREDGGTDEECKRFLWCLARRLEVSPRGEPAEPTPEDLVKVVPLQVVDFSVEAEDLESALKVVLDAAELCVDNPFGLYSFRAD